MFALPHPTSLGQILFKSTDWSDIIQLGPLFYIRSYITKVIANRRNKHTKIIIIIPHEASRGAEAQSETVYATGYGFDPYSMIGIIYLNLYFHCSGVEAKRGV